MIFTDSSHYRGVGSWSVLFKSEENLIISGICPQYVITAAQGEAYAVFKAVELAKTLFPQNKRIRIHTDCIGLCSVLQKSSIPQKNPINRMIQQAILKRLIQNQYEWTIAFVRSHQDLDDLSSVCNNLVDLHARRIRRKNQNNQPNNGYFSRVLEWFHQMGFSHPFYFKLLEKTFCSKVTPEFHSSVQLS